MATTQIKPVNPPIIAPEMSLQQRRRRKKLRASLKAYLFIAPAFIILIIFRFLPIFYAFFLSLYKRISVIKGPIPPSENFAGFFNYNILFANPEFWTAFFNTLGFAIGVVTFGILLALGLALLLDKVQEGKNFYRTAFFLPNVTSLVAVGAVWKVLFTSYSATALAKANPNHPGGLLNWFFSGFGLPMQRWLLDERGIFTLLFNGGKTVNYTPSVNWPLTIIEIVLAAVCFGAVSSQSRNYQLSRVVAGIAALLFLPIVALWLYLMGVQIINFPSSPLGSGLAIIILLALAFGLLSQRTSLRKSWAQWAANYLVVVGIVAVLSALINFAELIKWNGWLSGPSLAMVCIIIIAIWHSLGFNVVILLAGLTNINRELNEAAKLDGAHGFSMLRFITIPLLSPTLFFLLIISTITALQTFTIVYSIFYTSGNSTTIPRTIMVLSAYYYQAAFGGASDSDVSGFGYASAIVMFMLVFILALTLVQQRVVGKRVNYD